MIIHLQNQTFSSPFFTDYLIPYPRINIDGIEPTGLSEGFAAAKHVMSHNPKLLITVPESMARIENGNVGWRTVNVRVEGFVNGTVREGSVMARWDLMDGKEEWRCCELWLTFGMSSGFS